MSISTQLPPISLAAASAGLRALAQAAGQTLEARVLGQLANGLTQIQLGQQNLAVALPTPQTPGTVLSLAVDQSQGQLRLTVLSTRPPVSAAPAPIATSSSAAATVQLSPAAISARDTGAPVPAQASAGGAAPAVPSAPAATTVTAPAATPTGAAPKVATAAPAGPNAPGAGPQAPAVVTTSPAPVVTAATPGPVLPGGTTTAPAQAQPTVTSPATGAPAPVPQAAPTGAVPTAAALAGGVRPVIPYAAAMVAPAAPQVPQGNSATVALPPVQQVAVATAVGQHDGPAGRPVPGATAQVVPSASPAAPTSASPQQALAQMVQQSLPRQNSVLALTAALTTALGRAGVPEPVAKAAQQVLGRQTVLDGKIDAASLRAAVRDSGVFHEALLGAGRPAAAAGDLKAALLGLQRELGKWLGAQGPVDRVAQVPPPLRGLTPRARSRDVAVPDLPSDPREAGKVLQERTEHALGRLRLHQNASLPDTAPRADTNWSMDLPVVIHGHPTLLHLQIQHDAEDEVVRPEDRGWQIRFAVNMGDYGEVGAQISMRGKTTGILLWADDADTADRLNAALGELREDLASVGLLSGALVVRAGAPLDEPKPPPRDHLVDEVR